MRIRNPLLSAIALCELAASTQAHAQDAKSARTFVESLYKLYTKDSKGIPSSGPEARLYYHSSLLALMRADERAVGPGYVGAIDSDPVCGCQDWNGIWDLHVYIQVLGMDRALAKVSFALSAPDHRNSDDMRRETITLVPENGNWRIWNISDKSDPKNVFDVRQALKQEIRRLTKQPKGAANHD